MKRLTWEQAEARYPECSAAADRDRLSDLIGDVELVELSAYYGSTGPTDTLWLMVNGEFIARYLAIPRAWCRIPNPPSNPLTMRLRQLRRESDRACTTPWPWDGKVPETT